MGCMSLALIEQGRRAGLPGVFVVHDDWLDYGFERDQWIKTWRGPRRGRVAPLVERACSIATAVDVDRAGKFVFNSRYTLSRARMAGIAAAGAKVIYPGIDERFLEQLAPQPWRWHIVYVGRIDRQKGIDTAVRALSHLPPEATLTVYGTGDNAYIAEMEALAEQLGATDRVRFKGFVSGPAVRRAYADADAVVFPVRWNEPFGLSPLEAMGMGRPVVTTARGGTAEFVRDGENALVFDADDAQGLAACVRCLAEDDAVRNRLLEGGHLTAGRFTATRFAELTVDEIVNAASSAAVALES